MVNNQEWFDKEYHKEEKEIEIENEKFQGSLVIENYSELKDLYLQNVKSMDKVTLKNLTQLQELTIWDCGMQDLVIENCLQIKKLNVRRNLLTSLKFLGNLENLEKLELDGNTRLIEILKPYQNDWRAYRKNIQDLIKSARENPQRLLNENEKLKEELEFSQQKYNTLKKTLDSFSNEIQEQIKEKEINELDNEIEKTEAKTKELIKLTNTQELLASLEDKLKKLKRIKEEKEAELRELRNKNQELEQKLKEQIALCQKKEVDLNIQQKLAEEIKKQWKEALLESVKKESNSTEKEKWEQKSKELETKLDETKKKEYKLEGELKAVKDEVNYLRDLWEKQEGQSKENLTSMLVSQLKEKLTLTPKENSYLNSFLKNQKNFSQFSSRNYQKPPRLLQWTRQVYRRKIRYYWCTR